MNKKTVLKMIFLMIAGGIFGIIISKGLLKLNDTENIKIISNIGDFFVNNNIVIFLLLLISIYIPSVYLFIKGKSIFDKIDAMSDDECEIQIKIGQKKFDIALSLNAVFLILNFMLLGMTFDNSVNNEMGILFIFMFNIISSSMLEIITIRFIQKVDSRLKGDPTSLRFSKDFLESCDEAEKLKLYKSGYHAFQISKLISLGFVVFTILCNLLLDTGGFPVFVSCSLMLAHISSYSYYAIYKN